jgi:hypothetical protein
VKDVIKFVEFLLVLSLKVKVHKRIALFYNLYTYYNVAYVFILIIKDHGFYY